MPRFRHDLVAADFGRSIGRWVMHLGRDSWILDGLQRVFSGFAARCWAAPCYASGARRTIGAFGHNRGPACDERMHGLNTTPYEFFRLIPGEALRDNPTNLLIADRGIHAGPGSPEEADVSSSTGPTAAAGALGSVREAAPGRIPLGFGTSKAAWDRLLYRLGAGVAGPTGTSRSTNSDSGEVARKSRRASRVRGPRRDVRARRREDPSRSRTTISGWKRSSPTIPSSLALHLRDGWMLARSVAEIDTTRAGRSRSSIRAFDPAARPAHRAAFAGDQQPERGARYTWTYREGRAASYQSKGQLDGPHHSIRGRGRQKGPRRTSKLRDAAFNWISAVPFFSPKSAGPGRRRGHSEERLQTKEAEVVEAVAEETKVMHPSVAVADRASASAPSRKHVRESQLQSQASCPYGSSCVGVERGRRWRVTKQPPFFHARAAETPSSAYRTG